MKKIYLLSDLFANEVVGGAEICNEAIIDYIKNNNFIIEKKRTSEVNQQFLLQNKDCWFLIANFMLLSEEAKKHFIDNFKNKYIIIEHDHKYASNNNPSIFPNFVLEEENIINKYFYKYAKAVLAQSSLHAEVINKNLLLDNLVNLAGNVWTDRQIEILKQNIGKEKTIEYAIFDSKNRNKGMQVAIEYCRKNNLKYELLPLQQYDKFIDNLSKVKNLVFFPQWLETFSRVSIEAKILGCKIITNKLIGAASEPFFKQSPLEIVDYIKQSSERIPQLILDIFMDKQTTFHKKVTIPKISIITSVYKCKKFISGFMNDITNQTIFNNCELIIIDANSPENEIDIIRPFLEKYKNIIYIKENTRISVQQSMNKAINLCSGEFITIASTDDRHHPEALEILSKHLFYNNDIDLVYSDCKLSLNENETFEECKSTNRYEHSIFDFSPENMIKCLPGPMPMWKKTMSIKNGKFDESLKFAGDWEFWLRCVKNGSKFKKIKKTLGLYYFNPNGLSTSSENRKERFEEERKIFSNYRDIFGKQIFNQYKEYFNVT